MIKRRIGRDFDLSINVKVGDDGSIVLNNSDYEVVMTSEFGTEHKMSFVANGNVINLHFDGKVTASWPWGRYKMTLLHNGSSDLDIPNILELVASTAQETA